MFIRPEINLLTIPPCILVDRQIKKLIIDLGENQKPF